MNIPPAVGIVRHLLREATADRHAALDRLFADLDLGRQADYARLLRVHARAVPALEKAGMPASARTPLLRGDMAALGEAMPPELDFAIADEAERWGVRYVLEGSRLGGAMLARAVAPGLPRAYLAATHGPGEWRAFQQSLDAAAGAEDWCGRAAAAADRAFALFLVAARMEGFSHG